jgi:L-iditol 2-dehydrogenase
MTAPGTIRFDDVPPPAAGPGELIARVRRIGVCGSDIHVFHGKHPYTSYPVVQGHEFSAEITEASGGLRAGTLVTMPPQITCGACESCRGGRYHICETLKVMGFQAPGVAQEFVALPRGEVIALPAEFTPEMGALVEPVAVAMHAVGRAGQVAGARVLVLGAGPIGNLARMRRAGAATRRVLTDVGEVPPGDRAAVRTGARGRRPPRGCGATGACGARRRR